MSELLSDDQLGALLGQAGAGGAGPDEIGETSQALDYQALQRAMGRLADRIQSVLATVLNRKITGEITSCEKADFRKAAAIAPGETLDIHLPLSGGLQGSLHIIMTKKDVAILSDLMMLGDGSAPYHDDHRDAIGELANQFFGAYISQINGDGLTPPASAGVIEVQDGRLPQLSMPESETAMAVLRLHAEGVLESRSVLFLPDPMGRAMIALTRALQPSQEKASMQETVGLSEQELDDLAQAGEETKAALGFTETPLVGAKPLAAPRENIDMLLDVDLDVSIELGQANLSIKRILELAPGSIIELNRMAGEPVDLLVNNKVVAKGEVVVVDENFGIRIVSLVSAEDRIRSLR